MRSETEIPLVPLARKENTGDQGTIARPYEVLFQKNFDNGA